MADPDRFRKEVQSRVEAFLSKPRDQDPKKFALEAAVELFKLYQLFKEEKAKEAKEGKGKRRRKMGANSKPLRGILKHRSKYEELTGEEHDRPRRKHRGRQRERSRSRSPRDQDRRRERRRRYEEDKQIVLREKLPDDNDLKDTKEQIPDPVTEPLCNDSKISVLDLKDPFMDHSRFMMSGGAGPRGTLLSPDDIPVSIPSSVVSSFVSSRGQRTSSPLVLDSKAKAEPRQQYLAPRHNRPLHRSRSRSRSPVPRVRKHRSGEDGERAGRRRKKSGRGRSRDEESRKGSNSGLVGHFMSVYKEIKAEYDAGHRSTGLIERKIDEMRGKKKDGKSSKS